MGYETRESKPETQGLKSWRRKLQNVRCQLKKNKSQSNSELSRLYAGNKDSLRWKWCKMSVPNFVKKIDIFPRKNLV